MRLSKMFKNAPTTNITGLCFDSRKVKPGDMYFCLPGLVHDGHEFIDQAVDAGAIAIVHSKDLHHRKEGAIYLKVDDVNAAMNMAAKIFYNRPAEKMKMFGITGTNGKSSVANIIRHLDGEDVPTGYIGTIAIAYGQTVLSPDLTTPDPIFLERTLNDMSNAHMEACALECSSHGLAQGRLDAIDFDVVIFTNFTYDHLDYHGTMDNYFSAKSILFSDRVKPYGVCVLNADDPKSEELRQLCTARVVSYGIQNAADYRAINVSLDHHGTHFTLVHAGNTYPVTSNLVGEFNVSNLLAALAGVVEAGLPIEKAIERCTNIPQIPGRLEQISLGQPFNVIVDFAHTPDGLEKVMQLGRSLCKPGGSLIAVFGSAGQRDKAKRPVFGQMAQKYCDALFLTEDDPRDEDPAKIADEIRSGLNGLSSVFIADRYEAIRQAIESAQDGDTVLILGKGDEPFMYREHGRAPWIGDNVAAKECIERVMKDKHTQEESQAA